MENAQEIIKRKTEDAMGLSEKNLLCINCFTQEC